MNQLVNIPVKILFLVFFIPFTFCNSSCKNDHQEQLLGTWEMTHYRINHFDEHEDINVIWRFEKNGRFHQTINYPQQVVNETAEWIKSADDTLIINYTLKKNEVKWRIVFMDDETLEIEHITPGFFVERSFTKK